MLRAMMLEFPDDPACNFLDLQYMLGDSLLVAPVLSHRGNVNYYVPEGKWTDLLDGHVVEGPRWVKETRGFMSLPLLVRPNTVLPVGSRTDKPDYDYSDGISLQVYQLEDGRSAYVEIPALNGKIETSFDIRREGKMIHLQRRGSAKTWNVLLVGIDTVENVENAEMVVVDSSTRITVSGETSQITLYLK